jgi:hypothetical protein
VKCNKAGLGVLLEQARESRRETSAAFLVGNDCCDPARQLLHRPPRALEKPGL